MRNKNCHICQSDQKVTDIKGAIFPWKDFNSVELLVSFDALKCQGCGEIMLSGDDLVKLDDALENSIRNQTSDFLQKIKQKTKLSQKELAKKIGITEVYFSEIISMKKTVSSQIFNYCKILSNHPRCLSDLDSFKGKSDLSSQSIDSSSVLRKFKFIEKEEVVPLSNDRHFKGMLDETVEALH